MSYFRVGDVVVINQPLSRFHDMSGTISAVGIGPRTQKAVYNVIMNIEATIFPRPTHVFFPDELVHLSFLQENDQ